MEASISREEFAFLLSRAGIDAPAETIAELHGVYGHLEQMLARVRAHDDGEPLHVFAPVELP